MEKLLFSAYPRGSAFSPLSRNLTPLLDLLAYTWAYPLNQEVSFGNLIVVFLSCAKIKVEAQKSPSPPPPPRVECSFC